MGTWGDRRGGSALLLVVGATGVVFGDIGTSTLYTLATALDDRGATVADAPEAMVYGATSTLLWLLILAVSVLYVGLVLRADNDGEGGLLALYGLVRRSLPPRGAAWGTVTAIAVVGAAMFLGDSVITPAISVLSAAEGLELIDPALTPAVVPIAVVLLGALFALQRFGTGRIGVVFGPIMLVWFAALTVVGMLAIVREPGVLQALSPTWAVRYTLTSPGASIFTLGALVLAVTGAEALYADLGHFGRRPIALAWTMVVFPALAISYLGQAANIAAGTAGGHGNPFFAAVPGGAELPVVLLATLATLIASQAVISGAFSVVRQAARLGLLPMPRLVHTSAAHPAQIYVPVVNVVLGVSVLVVVVMFESSAALAAAYGVAVTTTIAITCLLFTVYCFLGRRWVRFAAAGALSLLAAALVVATAPKIGAGGWLPLLIAAVLITLMASWVTTSRRLAAARAGIEPALTASSVRRLLEGGVERRPGSAVFFTDDDRMPVALSTLAQLFGQLPRSVVIVRWTTTDTPRVARAERLRVDRLDEDGVVLLTARFGFAEQPRVRLTLRLAAERARDELHGFDADAAVFYLSETLVPPPSTRRGLRRARQVLYRAMARLAPHPSELLDLPPERVIVVGRRVEP